MFMLRKEWLQPYRESSKRRVMPILILKIKSLHPKAVLLVIETFFRSLKKFFFLFSLSEILTPNVNDSFIIWSGSSEENLLIQYRYKMYTFPKSFIQ